MTQKKREHIILFLYLSAFLILACTLAFFQPVSDTPPLYGNPPDEHARILIPQFICNHGTIPTGLEEEVRIPGYGFSYGLYNVFPYILQGYTMRFAHLFTESQRILLYSARGVNILFGFLMAFVVYLLSKRLFKDDRFRWLFCFAVMFLPQNIFIHTYINTDSCCLFSTSMMIYALVCCYQDGINNRNSLWMSGGIILCALSYYNAYGYILSCIFLFVAYFVRKKDGKLTLDLKEMLRWGIRISCIVLLGISWWFIRSYFVLDGDILGLSTREKLAEQFAVEAVNPLTMKTYQEKGYTLLQMFRENNTMIIAFYSFVAVYGSMAIFASRWMYWSYELFFGLGILGCLFRLCLCKKRRQISGKEWFFHLNMLFCIGMPLFLMIYYAYTMDYQHQGRYLLPALIPFMYYMVKGLQQLTLIKKGKFAFPEGLIRAAVILSIAGLVFVAGYMIYVRALPIYLQTGVI